MRVAAPLLVVAVFAASALALPNELKAFLGSWNWQVRRPCCNYGQYTCKDEQILCEHISEHPTKQNSAVMKGRYIFAEREISFLDGVRFFDPDWLFYERNFEKRYDFYEPFKNGEATFDVTEIDYNIFVDPEMATLSDTYYDPPENTTVEWKLKEEKYQAHKTPIGQLTYKCKMALSEPHQDGFQVQCRYGRGGSGRRRATWWNDIPKEFPASAYTGYNPKLGLGCPICGRYKKSAVNCSDHNMTNPRYDPPPPPAPTSAPGSPSGSTPAVAPLVVTKCDPEVQNCDLKEEVMESITSSDRSGLSTAATVSAIGAGAIVGIVLAGICLICGIMVFYNYCHSGEGLSDDRMDIEKFGYRTTTGLNIRNRIAAMFPHSETARAVVADHERKSQKVEWDEEDLKVQTRSCSTLPQDTLLMGPGQLLSAHQRSCGVFDGCSTREAAESGSKKKTKMQMLMNKEEEDRNAALQARQDLIDEAKEAQMGHADEGLGLNIRNRLAAADLIPQAEQEGQKPLPGKST